MIRVDLLQILLQNAVWTDLGCGVPENTVGHADVRPSGKQFLYTYFMLVSVYCGIREKLICYGGKNYRLRLLVQQIRQIFIIIFVYVVDIKT